MVPFSFSSRHLTQHRVDTVDTNSEYLLSLTILLPVETCLGISILTYLKDRYPRYYLLLVSGCTLNRGARSKMKELCRAGMRCSRTKRFLIAKVINMYLIPKYTNIPESNDEL